MAKVKGGFPCGGKQWIAMHTPRCDVFAGMPRQSVVYDQLHGGALGQKREQKCQKQQPDLILGPDRQTEKTVITTVVLTSNNAGCSNHTGDRVLPDAQNPPGQ